MGLISGLLTLPLAPVRGVAWVAEQLHEEAERQLRSPQAIQERLAELEMLRDTGQIDAAEADALQAELVELLLDSSPSTGLAVWQDEGELDG
jgi:hypothetical protein